MRRRYLRPSLSLPEIYLYRAPVDFRKQAQGLAVLVEQGLHLLAAFANLMIGEKYLLAQGQCARIPPKWLETGKK